MRKFTKNDNSFECIVCGNKVPKLEYTSRDHCPKCLCSLHVDISPGDRQNDCMGVMRPVSAEISRKKGYIIIFKCEKCGEIKKNKAAADDDTDYIIRLTAEHGY